MFSNRQFAQLKLIKNTEITKKQFYKIIYPLLIIYFSIHQEGYFTTPVRKQKTQNLFARQAAPLIHKVSRQWSKRKKSHTFSEVKVRSENCLLDPKYSLKLNYLEPEPNISMSNDELSTSRQPKTSLNAFKKRALHQTMSDTTAATRTSGRISTSRIPSPTFTPPLINHEQPPQQAQRLDIESRVTRLENKLETMKTENEQKLDSILAILTEIKTAQQLSTISQDSGIKSSHCVSASYDHIDYNQASLEDDECSQDFSTNQVVIDNLDINSSSPSSSSSNNSSSNGSCDECDEKSPCINEA